jgi:ABC-type cobalt transport system substrate-binding protein
MKNKSFTHILQKTGVLKTFTVAKIVNNKDIDDLKALIKIVASNAAEYKKMLKEEMDKISNLHDENNPIPGIIYTNSENEIKKLLFSIASKFCKGIKTQNFSKRELTLLISAIVNDLGLTQEDFVNLKEELENGDDGEDDDDDEDGTQNF